MPGRAIFGSIFVKNWTRKVVFELFKTHLAHVRSEISGLFLSQNSRPLLNRLPEIADHFSSTHQITDITFDSTHQITDVTKKPAFFENSGFIYA